MPELDRESRGGAAWRSRIKLLIWPAGVVLLIVTVALIWIWSVDSPQRQTPLHKTILTGLGATLVLGFWFVIWLLFLSRLRWRARLACLGALVAVALFLGLSIEMQGLTGDAVPILGWRWAARAGEAEFVVPPQAAAGEKLAATRSDHDYPQFLGPRRDGSVTEVRLARDWPKSVKPLWRQPIGAGWSGFAVSGAYAVTQEQRGSSELVSCYDPENGALLWAHSDDARWYDPLGGLGPRATPTILDGRVYALGGTGLLNVLDLRSGERIWSRNILDENGAQAPTYGVSSSPLIVGDAVVVSAGGPSGNSLVAYHRETGERLWSGGDDRAAYSSPVLAELGGRQLVLLLSNDNVVGHDASSGAVLMSFPWPPTEMVSQVLVLPGGHLFVSSGYGVGAKLLKPRAGAGDRIELEPVWESRAMKAKFTNVVHREGYLYGLDDGILACVDTSDGERQWKGGRYGHGQVILVHDLLLVLAEDGRVALVQAEPDAYTELAGFPALEGKTWNHPALAGRLLLVRNDREAACYELPLEPDAIP